MIKAGIVGGTGYTGIELLRLLAQHPQVELAAITSRQEAGKAVSALFPSLRGRVSLAFSHPDKAPLAKCDVVFFATPNGVAMGAWATKTNVSAEQFGEGSFDKGIFVHVPFDLMFPKTSADVAQFVWNPLTRDGGARLGRSVALYDLTNLRDARPWRLTSKPAAQGPQRTQTADNRAYVMQDDGGGLLANAMDAA